MSVSKKQSNWVFVIIFGRGCCSSCPPPHALRVEILPTSCLVSLAKLFIAFAGDNVTLARPSGCLTRSYTVTTHSAAMCVFACNPFECFSEIVLVTLEIPSGKHLCTWHFWLDRVCALFCSR